MELYRAICLTCLSIAIFAVPAGSAIISRDWKSPGDGLLTYDDVNQREWLDLPFLIQQFPGALRVTEPRYQAVLQALGPGHLLEGFTIAKHTDVIALGLSAGIDVSTTNHAVNAASTRNLLELLGETYQFLPSNTFFSAGMLDDYVNTPAGPRRLIATLNHDPPFHVAGLGTYPAGTTSDDVPGLRTSVFVYRQVPEPAAFCMVLAVFAWLRISPLLEKARRVR